MVQNNEMLQIIEYLQRKMKGCTENLHLVQVGISLKNTSMKAMGEISSSSKFRVSLWEVGNFSLFINAGRRKEQSYHQQSSSLEETL
jgi:hypothetical protein